jgi:K+-transporting ATPase KdpF subunit
LCCWLDTLTPATNCEENVMIEPIAGLVVALGLGFYLLYTLLHPEKF